MGIFGDRQRSALLELVEHNADVIQTQEGRTRHDAEYLALCLVLDDLASRENGQEGHQKIMHILQREYARHHSDVMTYLAYTRMNLALKPEIEAALQTRHGNLSQIGADQAPNSCCLTSEEAQRNFNDFHRLWTLAASSTQYNKQAWLDIERQLLVGKVIGA